MGRERTLLVGRAEALGAVVRAGRSTVDEGGLVVVRGASGIGKTKLVAAASRALRMDACPTQLWIEGGASSGCCGVDEVLRVLRRNFADFADAGLVDGIGALARLAGEEDGTATHHSVVSARLRALFGRIGGRGRTLVVVDDAQAVGDVATLLLAARRPGCLVLATVGDDPAADELVALADEVVDLEPLGDGDIARITGTLPDETREALRGALGPWYGNPGTVLETLRMQEDLAVSGDSIRLPDGHELLDRVRGLDERGRRLLALVAAVGTFDVDELPRFAALLEDDVVACGRTLDRLAGSGLLSCDERGRLACSCPALAKSVEDPVMVWLCGSEVVPAVLRSVGAGPGRPVAGEDLPRWSAAEIEMVRLISSGFTNRRIASALGVTEKTVESRLTRLFARTGCRTRAELVAAELQGRLRSGPGQVRRDRAA